MDLEFFALSLALRGAVLYTLSLSFIGHHQIKHISLPSAWVQYNKRFHCANRQGSHVPRIVQEPLAPHSQNIKHYRRGLQQENSPSL